MLLIPAFLALLGLARCSADNKYLVLGLEDPADADRFCSTFFIDAKKAEVVSKSLDTTISLSIKGQNIFGQSQSSLLLFKDPFNNVYDVIATTLRWSKFDSIRGIIVLSHDTIDYDAAFRRFLPLRANFIQIYEMIGKNHLIVDQKVYSWTRKCEPYMLFKIQQSFAESQPIALVSTLVNKSLSHVVAKYICDESGNSSSRTLFAGNFSLILASIFPIEILDESIARFDLDITAYLVQSLAPPHFEALAKMFPTLHDVMPLLRNFVPEQACTTILTDLGRHETESRTIFQRLKAFHTSKATEVHDHCVVSLVSDSCRVPIFRSILAGRIRGISEKTLLSPFFYYLHWLAISQESRKNGSTNISRADQELSLAIEKIDDLIEEYRL